MRKALLIMILFISFNGLFADGSQAFKLDLKKDLIIGSTSLAAFSSGYLFKSYKEHNDYNTNAFGWFDEGSSFKYSDSTDSVGTLLALSPLLSIPLLVDEWQLEDISTIGVMYIESALLTYGLKDLLKGAISRPRPFIHRDDVTQELLDDRDSYFSFPSGHTSIAFMTASFSTYIFSQGESSNLLKWTMGISTFSLATLTGVLRVTSGAHYPTDVLAGALFGSGVGFFIPYMHKVLPDNMAFVASGNYVGLSLNL